MGLLGVCVVGISRRVRHLGGGCCNLSWRCLEASNGVRRVLYSTSGASHGNNNSTEPWIPEYKPRSGEHVETKRSRLLYQSRKRGMLENGLVLSTFAARYLSDMSPVQLDLYDSLINRPSNDWDIYYWATGAAETPVEYSNEIMDMLKSFVRNADRESRLSQPDLYPV